MLIKVWVIPLLYLDFEIRRDYIAANLCINKNRPKLNCNGKCYLAKKLKALEEQEKKQAEQNLLHKVIDTSADSQVYTFRLQPQTFSPIENVSLFRYESPYAARLAVDDIFHPPCQA